MKVSLFFAPVIVLVLSACSEVIHDREEVDSHLIPFMPIEGTLIAATEPDSSYMLRANQLEKVTAADPQIIPLKEPVTLDATKQVTRAGDARVRIAQGFTAPVPVEISPKTVRTGLPVITTSKDPYLKAENSYSFGFYTRHQGLAHDDISALAEDPMGNLWLGTYGGGLIRFDGSTFSHYTTEQGLPENDILTVHATDDGRIWMGTRRSGLVIFDGKKFSVFDEEQGFPIASVETIFEDSQGNIWLGTFGGGVVRHDGDLFTQFTSYHGLAHDVVYTIEEDADQNIWLGTRGGGISVFNGEHFFNYTTQQGLSSNYILDFAQDDNGLMWVGTDGGGLMTFDGVFFTHYGQNAGFPDDDILCLLTSSGGDVWIGTRQAGIIRYDGQSFTSFTEAQGLINSFITVLSEDKNSNLWFGTYGGGLGYYQGDVFRHYSEYEGLPHGFIRSITAAEDSDYPWLGSHSQGLFKLHKGYLLQYTTEHGLPDNRLRSVFKEDSGKLWLGFLNHGLAIFYDGYFYLPPRDALLATSRVLHIQQSSNGDIWLATGGDGVFCFDGERFINYSTEQGLSSDHVVEIAEDQSGNMWFATRRGGINMFDGDSFVHYTENEGLPANEYLSLFIDGENTIWAGTYGSGLIKIKENRLFHFTERHGLSNNFVYSFIEDNNRNVWIGTRLGLNQFLDADYIEKSGNGNYYTTSWAHSKGIFFKAYSRNDGFMGTGVNSSAMYKASDNTIWIGSNDILTVFNPHKLPLSEEAPEVQIQALGLFNESVPWLAFYHNQDTLLRLANGMEISNFNFDGVSPWYGLPHNLTLAHYNNYICFNFVGISPAAKGKVGYTYKLEGFENDWNNVTYARRAFYGNLSPGSYNFRVKAVNIDGSTSEELQFPFTIKRPWWSSTWALAMYFILLLGFSFWVYFWRKEQARKREEKKQEELLLQKEVEVAQKSLEFKKNFLANMSHEIRTPLTGILGMAEVMKKTSLTPEQSDYLDTLIHSGENLRETINLVLDYSKIEAGKVNIKEEAFAVEKLFRETEKLFFSISKKEIHLNISIEQNVPPYIQGDYKRVFQIISNLLSNAVKFTPKGKINIHVSAMDFQQPIETQKSYCYIKVSVSDTGIGISPEKQKELFQPFYQAEQTYDRSHEGTGLGLSICREVAKLLGGNVDFKSTPGKGSTFWFTFRAKKVDMPKKDDLKQPIKEVVGEKSLRVLLVEDKKVNQKVIQLLLHSQNHKVDIVENGQQALEFFEPGKFDLVLMDIQMPVMDGIAATHRLREKYTNLPPIVGLSANAFEGDREKYMSMGMDEYITKPVKENDFANLVNKLNL